VEVIVLEIQARVKVETVKIGGYMDIIDEEGNYRKAAVSLKPLKASDTFEPKIKKMYLRKNGEWYEYNGKYEIVEMPLPPKTRNYSQERRIEKMKELLKKPFV
jgi:hypothetical protein